MKKDSNEIFRPKTNTEIKVTKKGKILMRAIQGTATVKPEEGPAETTTSTSFIHTQFSRCSETRARLGVAIRWYQKILENYNNPSEWIEYFTEAFLVSSRSVIDYVVRDFLECLEPKLNMNKISEINFNKTKKKEIEKLLEDYENKELVINFLATHTEEFNRLLGDVLVRYFFTLRNLIVHAGFPHIYENTYTGSGKNERVSQRRFQTEFVNYLLTENGGYLLTNNGDRIVLEGENSYISDFDYLSKLDPKEKQRLEEKLKKTESKDLLQNYLKLIENFVEKIESHHNNLILES